MQRVNLTVNGTPVSRDVEDETLLAVFLREYLNLTGTHVGCDTTQCGCCVVHLNGKSVKSCTVLAVQAQDGEVTTIEGLAHDGSLHPMQEAFHRLHALQCGYCTPGMIMAAVNLVDTYPEPLTESIVREEMEGNLCRCTGYHNIVKAILAAAAVMKPGQANAEQVSAAHAGLAHAGLAHTGQE
jgi:carbon-monoxide dehydrogenase small subunit